MSEELTTLAVRYALKYLYEKGDGSAQCCNAGALLLAALYGPEEHPQVPLEEIIEYARKELQ